MDGLNGIILNGKVYETIDTDLKTPFCNFCDIKEFCDKQYWDYNVYICHGLSEDDPIYFRFSQTLTDKLNGK